MTALRLHQLNDVRLVGRLTHDPELRFTTKGQGVCHFSLAVNRRYKDMAGEWKDETAFIPVVVWGELAQRCADRLKKGSPAYVEGRLKSHTWETKEGQKRTSIEVNSSRIQFLAKVEGEPEPSGDFGAEDSGAVKAAAPNAPAAGPEGDEDIPF